MEYIHMEYVSLLCILIADPRCQIYTEVAAPLWPTGQGSALLRTYTPPEHTHVQPDPVL